MKKKKQILLCEKKFEVENEKGNPIAKNHCQLTGHFRGLPHDNGNLSAQ